MKVVSVCTSARNGGAAIVASNLAHALSSHIDIIHVTQDSILSSIRNPFIAHIYKHFCSLKRKLARVLAVLDPYEKNIYKSYSIFPSLLPRFINNLNPDIVHLHWVQGEFLSIEDISKIKAPIVWTLHDCWAFSAAEHHHLLPVNREYITGYSGLAWHSLSRWVYSRKTRAWSNTYISTVSPSKWMFDKVSSSKLFANAYNVTIPNPLDLSVFRSHARLSSCQRLGLDPDRKYLLVGSLTSSLDPVKGFDLFSHALDYLNLSAHKLEILTFGTPSNFLADQYPVRSLGFIREPADLSHVYSAVDVTCVPSRIETHSQTAAESVACGTPVVCFDIAGNQSVVQHLSTGYLAQAFDCRDLALGIESCLLNTPSFSPTDFLQASSLWSEKRICQMYVQHFSAVAQAYSTSQFPSCNTSPLFRPDDAR